MRLLLIDDHILFREGLKSLLGSLPGFQVVGEASDGEEAIAKTLAQRPDLVLIEIGLKDGSGLETIGNILSNRPETKVVVLTLLELDETMIASIRAGAVGYMLKSTPVAKLTATLRAVMQGEAALSRKMTGRILEEFSRQGTNNGKVRSDLDCLTNREIEVLRFIGIGATNREIAENLFITEYTVKNHVHNILDKLNLKNRREAARIARFQGLVKSVQEIISGIALDT